MYNYQFTAVETCACGASTSITSPSSVEYHLENWRRTHRHELPPPPPPARATARHPRLIKARPRLAGLR